MALTEPDTRQMDAYPRPQLERDGWQSLNGPWEAALDYNGAWLMPEQVPFDRTIQVPFAPESEASGIGDTGFFHACWYRRTFVVPTPSSGERLLLHFGAVDYTAEVWVNGNQVAKHEGGYTPFFVDITDYLNGGEQTIVVRAHDDPHDLAKPRGKQDWQLRPHAIWYPRTTGIWQTVWLERVPSTWIASVRWTPCLERWEIGFEAFLAGQKRDDLRLH